MLKANKLLAPSSTMIDELYKANKIFESWETILPLE